MDLSELPVKCQKCRFHLCQYSNVLDSHGNAVNLLPKSMSEERSSPCSTEVWYIREDAFPEWMQVNLESGEWIKGKLKCPNCEARIGSYNFVSGMKCVCGSHVLPPIHIVKSKVDVILPRPQLIPPFYTITPAILQGSPTS